MPSVNLVILPESLEFELFGKGAYSYQKLVVAVNPKVELELMPARRPKNYFQTHVFWVPERSQWLGFHEVSDKIDCQFLGPFVIPKLLPPPPEDEVIAKAENGLVMKVIEIKFEPRFEAVFHVSYYDDHEALTGSEDIALDFDARDAISAEGVAKDLIRERIGPNDKFTLESLAEI